MIGRASHFGKIRKLFFLSAVFICFFFTGACGLKTYPKAPDRKPAPQIVALDKRIEENRLILNWEVSKSIDQKKLKPEGYVIYRSKGKLKDRCKGCPFVFEPVSERLFPSGVVEKGKKRHIEYREALDSGYHYVFKVNLKTAGGTFYPATRSINFDF